MESVYIYILKSILVSGILLGYYWLALRNTRFHHYNRFYLMATIFLALVLPTIDLNWFTLQEPEAVSAKQLLLFIDQPGSIALSEAAFTWEKLLFVSIVLVSLSMVAFFSFGIYKIYRIKAASKVTPMDRFDFVETKNDDAPFSFFRNLFWREDVSMEDQTGRQILRHELTHIEQLHTYDKLLIAMLSALFWMNPFLWIIRRELEVIHEFIADEKAVDEEDASALAAMLLQTHYQSTVFSTGQSFFYSSIKRRIIMLTSSKKVSYSYARRILTLPLAIGIIALLSFTIKDQLNNQTPSTEMQGSTVQNDTIPSQYRDAKTGKIKGSFQIDINGDTAIFKDIKSKKKLFQVPLSELSRPANKTLTVEGFPLYTEKKIVFISGDSMPSGAVFIGADGSAQLPPLTTPHELVKSGATRIIINGKEISPADLDKIEPSNIKTIDIRGAKEGAAVSGKNNGGMTWVESTTNDGKKVITVRVDSMVFDVKAKVDVPAHGNVSNISVSVDTSAVKTVTGYKANSNVKTITIRTSDDKVLEKAKTDPNEPITVKGYKANSNVSTVIVRTSDDKVVEESKKDPQTLTVTTTDKDGKKTITYVQKTTEKTALPKDLLYVIDGKEMESISMKDIDPNTIQSINVLKGENAVKKYGEKGKNGVIEITTKKN